MLCFGCIDGEFFGVRDVIGRIMEFECGRVVFEEFVELFGCCVIEFDVNSVLDERVGF